MNCDEAYLLPTSSLATIALCAPSRWNTSRGFVFRMFRACWRRGHGHGLRDFGLRHTTRSPKLASAEHSAPGLATRKQKEHNDHPMAGYPEASSHGGCAWETSGSAGFLLLRFANPRTTATHSFGDDCWQPFEQKELYQ